MKTQPLNTACSLVLLSCLEGLMTAMLVRDPHTAAHQERVGILSRRLARSYGLEADHVERVALAGRVHDIGKLGVSITLLSTPSPLTPTERLVVQSHALFGAKMLERIGAPADLNEAVQSHHERLDGRGYPLGLSNDQISIDARIVAVADVIDAMLSDRPHRRMRTIEDVEMVLDTERGRAYDPDVVDCALLELGRLEHEGLGREPMMPGCVSC